jgi:single-strand DNA-binding protein
MAASTIGTIDATNVAIVQGRLSGPPRRRELPSGSVLVELDVTTRGETGSSSVPVAWFEPESLAESLQAGDAVVVVGRVRRRFFRAAAATQSRTEVVAERVIPASRPARVARLLGEVAEALGGGR